MKRAKFLLALCALFLALPYPASAHTTLVSEVPAAESQVKELPSELLLTFAEALATGIVDLHFGDRLRRILRRPRYVTPNSTGAVSPSDGRRFEAAGQEKQRQHRQQQSRLGCV